MSTIIPRALRHLLVASFLFAVSVSAAVSCSTSEDTQPGPLVDASAAGSDSSPTRAVDASALAAGGAPADLDSGLPNGCTKLEVVTCEPPFLHSVGAVLLADGQNCTGSTCSDGTSCCTPGYPTCGYFGNPPTTVCLPPGAVNCDNPVHPDGYCPGASACSADGCCGSFEPCVACDANGKPPGACQCVPESQAELCGNGTLCPAKNNCGTASNCQCDGGYTCEGGKCVPQCVSCSDALQAYQNLYTFIFDDQIAAEKPPLCPGVAASQFAAYLACACNASPPMVPSCLSNGSCPADLCAGKGLTDTSTPDETALEAAAHCFNCFAGSNVSSIYSSCMAERAACTTQTAAVDAGPAADCNTLVDVGPTITSTELASAAPSPAGGKIALGTYILQSATTYATVAVQETSFSSTIRFTASTLEVVSTSKGADGGSTVQSTSGTYTAPIGTTFTLTASCPAAAPTTGVSYTATPTSFVLFAATSLNGGTVVTVSTYKLQ